MAVDEDRIESDIANMEVAFQRALDVMKEMTDKDLAGPVLTSVVETFMDALQKHPVMTILRAMGDDTFEGTIEIALLHSLLTGIEWGKSGREPYTFPAMEGCEDPTHSHHRSRLN